MSTPGTPSDPWQYWLSPHLPATPKWLADLRAPVPAEPALFGHLLPLDEAWDTPARPTTTEAFGLKDGQLTERRPRRRQHDPAPARRP